MVVVIIENNTKLVVIQQCKDDPIEIIEDLSSKNRCGQPEYDRIWWYDDLLVCMSLIMIWLYPKMGYAWFFQKDAIGS
jgi:hypothetical protein